MRSRIKAQEIYAGLVSRYLTSNAHANSMKVSAPLIRLITRQELDLDPKELSAQVKLLRTQIDESAEALQAQKLQQLTELAPYEMKPALKITAEKGASSWVTATPLYDHGTILHKGDFVDAIYMRYGGTLPNLSADCVCQISVYTAARARLHDWRLSRYPTQRSYVFAQLFRDA